MRREYALLLIVGLVFSWVGGESFSRDPASEKASDQRVFQKPEGKMAGNDPPVSAKEPTGKPYTAMVEKNIFSPDRKEFPIPVSPAPPATLKKPPARPQVILYGVTLAGDYQSATVVQPGRVLRKGEREMLTLKVGDRIGEYQLTKILSDRITFEAEEDRFEVLLDDATRPKMRTVVRTETKPATVTSALPGPTPVEPVRPVPPAPPASEPPRPTVPSQALPPERTVSPPLPTPITPPSSPTPITPPFLPTPLTPPSLTPSPVPTPQPTTPTSPPVYSPRRRVPLPSPPSPETSPQPPGQGGP